MKKTARLMAIFLTALGVLLASKIWLDPFNFVPPRGKLPETASFDFGYNVDGVTYAGACCGSPRPGVNEFPLVAIIVFGLSGLAVFALTLRTLQRHHSRQS